MKTIHTLGLLVAVATAGCAAAVPPQDLVTARSTYERAATGPAAQLEPADLHSARETLDVAENAFKKDGDTQETRDMSYTAARRAEIAEAHARTAESAKRKAQMTAQMASNQAAALTLTSAQLGAANQTIGMQNQALQSETARRQEAEKRLTQMAADLAKFASVKQETRGMVITLSGAVLFQSAKFDLLPAAQLKLNEVANALTKQDPDQKIVVEGHTDSQGASSFNQDLSQHRADSVRTYLVSRGVAADRITAQGFGPTRPIADNNSPEGRADNRRVEIVVQPKP